MTHPPGIVIVPCREEARYHGFTLCLRGLELPEGSGLIFGMGTNIVQNLNDSMAQVPATCEWVWLLGDDHTFDKDIVMRLLDRQLDVVAPLCARRGAPYPLVHFDEQITEDGLHGVMQYSELPDDDEPFEVAATGSSLLIRRHVWEKLEEPYFRNNRDEFITEDLNICMRIRQAGFKVHVDPSVAMGHYNTVICKPMRRDGVWGLHLDLQQGFDFFLEGGIGAQDPNVVAV